ncbi:hypothetical protein RDV64_22405 [Acuticoccus sp. MNP-M23]|uniref:hypothetical protein n=1 Tax=Acuticoccus sp. MNP-M23 TaxID=3072793 RepID=UPI002815D710|nr:hypothetical protein [Acuticoccus sp. MNP-M23]WMS42771.1 hypothetical protein RDV64_22405 [Acuticoccus sp. MNP-M23]
MVLTESAAIDAARYNRRKARLLGWRNAYPRIAVHLGFATGTVSATAFARHIHDWQAAQQPELTSDGKLGPQSWRRLSAALGPVGPGAPVPIPAWLGQGTGAGTEAAVAAAEPILEAPEVHGDGPLWIQVANFQRLRWEASGSTESETEWDEAYFLAAPRWGGRTHAFGQERDKARWKDGDWCAAFVNWCLHTAGYSHTGSAGANSFANRRYWEFDALEVPRRGCIVVLAERGANLGSHVAFLDDERDLPHAPGGRVTREARDHPDRDYRLLGGNQSGGIISSRWEPRWRDLLAARGRNGVVSPYLWPVDNSAGTCTMSTILPTRQAHSCHFAPPGGAAS